MKSRVNVWLETRQEDWYLYQLAETSLSFGGAVRQSVESHPDFVATQERLETDPAFAAEYAVKVDKGRAIRKLNIRR